MSPPGMARTETFKGHPPTFERAIFLDGFKSVSAASRGKSAFGTKEWRYSTLVKPDDGDE